MMTAILLVSGLVTQAAAFCVVPPSRARTTDLHMGLFDGVKEAFSAPALERSAIAADRETPIDRWMGWSVTSETTNKAAPQAGE
jgi:hypothetical protein